MLAAVNFLVTMGRRKALLIGINYTGSQHQLSGCQDDVENMMSFLISRGFPSDPGSMVVLTDARSGPFYPTGRNILAAMQWLVSEPGCSLVLHYSGHGGQVPDPDGDRPSGFDDTIVPVGLLRSPPIERSPVSSRAKATWQVDFEQNGQLDSDMLHRHLVSALPQNCTLFIIFDCCHSGSAVELPYVYRTDEDGNVSLIDNLRQGVYLVGEASHLIQGGFTYDKIGEARHLLAGATDFFRGLKHQGEQQEEGLQEDQFAEDWSREGKSVFMFSGCRDDQTSADAFIGGRHVGAMSWAFLETMKHDYNWDYSYVQVSCFPDRPLPCAGVILLSFILLLCYPLQIGRT